jgi:hypothetical protein
MKADSSYGSTLQHKNLSRDRASSTSSDKTGIIVLACRTIGEGNYKEMPKVLETTYSTSTDVYGSSIQCLGQAADSELKL